MEISINPSAEMLADGLQVSEQRQNEIISMVFAAVAFSKTSALAAQTIAREIGDNAGELFLAASIFSPNVERWNKMPGVMQGIIKSFGYEKIKAAPQYDFDSVRQALRGQGQAANGDASKSTGNRDMDDLASALGDILLGAVRKRKAAADEDAAPKAEQKDDCDCIICQIRRAVKAAQA